MTASKGLPVRTSPNIALPCMWQRAWHVAGSPDVVKSCMRIVLEAITAVCNVDSDSSLQEQVPLNISRVTVHAYLSITYPTVSSVTKSFDDVRHQEGRCFEIHSPNPNPAFSGLRM